MRLDEALGHQQVRLHRRPVNDQGRAGGQNADLHIAVRVKGVVDADGFRRGDFLPQLGGQLRFGGQTVEARGHQQGDLNAGIALPERPEHGGQNVPAGHGAGVVGDDDGAGFFARRQLRQSGGADGVCHGRFHQLPPRFVAFQRVYPGGQQAVTGKIPGKLPLAVWYGNHVFSSRHPVNSCP